MPILMLTRRRSGSARTCCHVAWSRISCCDGVAPSNRIVLIGDVLFAPVRLSSAALKKDVLELRDLLQQAPPRRSPMRCPSARHPRLQPYPYSTCTPSPPYALSLGPYQPRPSKSPDVLARVPAAPTRPAASHAMPCRPLRRRASRRTLFTSSVRGPSVLIARSVRYIGTR